MMCRQAVMFDLDGTLLDTLTDLADAMNAALDAMGFPLHDEVFYKKAVGDGAPQLASRALPEAARTPPLEARALGLLQAEYAQRWTHHTVPYPGIMPMLADLRRRKIKLAVLSNKPQAKTEDCVAHFFPEIPFDVIRGAQEGIALKPDPAAARQIMAQLEMPAAAWLYLGDTDTDMRTAKRAGLFAVGALWGFRDRAELIACGADAVVGDPGGLATLLGR